MSSGVEVEDSLKQLCFTSLLNPGALRERLRRGAVVVGSRRALLGLEKSTVLIRKIENFEFQLLHRPSVSSEYFGTCPTVFYGTVEGFGEGSQIVGKFRVGRSELRVQLFMAQLFMMLLFTSAFWVGLGCFLSQWLSHCITPITLLLDLCIFLVITGISAAQRPVARKRTDSLLDLLESGDVGLDAAASAYLTAYLKACCMDRDFDPEKAIEIASTAF